MKILVGADTTAAVQGFNTLETKIGAVKVLFAGFLATATIGGLVSFFKSSAMAAAEEEDGLKRLERQLERLGYSYATVGSEVDNLTKDIQNNTRFADDEAVAALTDLVQRTGDYGFAIGIINTATDIAAARGEALIDVTRKIGLAYNGNTRGLKELGVATKDAANWQEILRERYGGEARKDVEDYGGAIARLGNLFEELKDVAGVALLPVITEVTEAMKEWLQDENNIENLKAIAKLVADIAKGLIAAAPYIAAIGSPGKMALTFARDVYGQNPFSSRMLNEFGGVPGDYGPNNQPQGNKKPFGAAIDSVKELKFLTSGELLGNIKQLEGVLSSSKDPVVLSQAVKKLTEMRDLLRGFSNEKAFQSLAESIGVGAKDIPDTSGMEANPQDAVDNYWKNQFSKNMDAVRGKMDAEFARLTAQFNRVLNLAAMIGTAFQSRLASVFGSIRSMADLAAFKIRDVFQALGDAILDILSKIAAKMAAIGLLNLIGGFFGIPGLGGVLGPIIPSGNSIGGGSSFSPATPPVASGFGSNMAPATVYNIFHVQGSVVTERELMDKSRQYSKKMDRYGQA